jgi:hypothetical protein
VLCCSFAPNDACNSATSSFHHTSAHAKGGNTSREKEMQEEVAMVEEYHHHEVVGSLSFFNHGVLLPALLSLSQDIAIVHRHRHPPSAILFSGPRPFIIHFSPLFSSIACPLSLESPQPHFTSFCGGIASFSEQPRYCSQIPHAFLLQTCMLQHRDSADS